MASIGLSPALVDAWLNTLNGVSYVNSDGLWVQLHTGIPGAAGTSNVSQYGTPRKMATLGVASGGSIALTGVLPQWYFTGTESITCLSVWTLVTNGMFLWSAELATPMNVNDGETRFITTLGIIPSTIATS
jgi:hypothetical protein